MLINLCYYIFIVINAIIKKNNSSGDDINFEIKILIVIIKMIIIREIRILVIITRTRKRTTKHETYLIAYILL